MKQYVIDELRPGDTEKLSDYLAQQFGPPSMGTIFWIPIPETILTSDQAKHKTCQPHSFAVNLEDSKLVCELLIRTRNVMRCNCIGYATPEQREWIIQYVDSLFDHLSLTT
ncbi:MAG: hypothetical protein SWH61_12880 [Thermodesulfobacteriota bacterium]|nr:hypothetical protein [Thermodesulfobacteriota bacterium]